jgi:hypothetical protein
MQVLGSNFLMGYLEDNYKGELLIAFIARILERI